MPQTEKPNLVIVDNDEDVLDLVVEVLPPECVIQAFTNPLEAVRCFEKTESIDGLITDLEMPELWGDELIELAFSFNPALKVIVITGRPDSPRLTKFRAESRIKILAKPISLDTLEGFVETHLLGGGT